MMVFRMPLVWLRQTGYGYAIPRLEEIELSVNQKLLNKVLDME